MRKPAIRSLLAVFAGVFGLAPAALAGGEVNLYSYRQPDLIQPALDAFTGKTGIAVNVLYLDKGMIERMKTEGENSPADVILTVDVARLAELKQAGVTQPLDDAVLDAAIPAKFRDPEGHWFGLSMDARVVYAAKDRVQQSAITYRELADPRWKGKLCIRDGQHASNLGLFADRIAALGAEKTKEWLGGMKANLAGRPSGSDPDQAQAVAEGKCDLALGNATVVAQMLTGAAADERKWAEAVRVIYPDAASAGSYANVSGMALAKYAPDRDNAVKLMEFLAAKEAQELYARETLEYPIAAGAQPADVVKAFGTFKPDSVPMSAVIKYRDEASELVDKVGFNDGPGE
jgi:iron(III) transport system substrate-binding protein